MTEEITYCPECGSRALRLTRDRNDDGERLTKCHTCQHKFVLR